MRARSVAAAAAVAAVVFWGLKALAIWSAGGLGASPFESPLFALGAVSVLTAVVALGVSLAAGRSLVWHILAGVAGLVVGVAFFLGVEETVSNAVPASAGWVREEAGLWVLGVLVALAAITWWRRGPGHQLRRSSVAGESGNERSVDSQPR